MIDLTIDGRNIQAAEGLTILQVARRENIDIPTLCHHDALEPYGACRLCTVEVTVGKRTRFVTACNYTITDGMNVKTASHEVTEVRTMILELLLARCPGAKAIRDLAKSYGIERPGFESENETCMLCGLCVRVCKEIIGACAIDFVSSGVDTKIDTPFHLPSEVCIGCGACAAICPTGSIQLTYTEDEVEIKPFNTVVELRKCVSCGKQLASEEQLSSVGGKLGRLGGAALLCGDCKRRKESIALAEGARFFKNS